MNMPEITRFGVSLPKKSVEEFDSLLRDLGYSNRSKAINDAMRDFITQKRWVKEGGEFIGVISYIYNHESGAVIHKLIDLQHSYSNLIRSTMHSHLKDEDCMEVIIVLGKQERIKKLFDEISAVRDVKNCKFFVLAYQ